MADADWVSALVSLGSMAATALAHKKAIKQKQGDTLADTKYDIGMEEAAARGYRPARYMQQMHDALTANSRLNRIPVDYGQALSGLGRSIPGAIGSLSGGSAGDPHALPDAPSVNLMPNGLELPKSVGPIYPGGSSPSVTGQVGAPEIDLRAPDWSKLRLPDDLEEY